MLIYRVMYQFSAAVSQAAWTETGMLWSGSRVGGQHVAPEPTHVHEGHEQRHSVDCESRRTAVFLKPL